MTTVLVVEDEAVVADVVERYLRRDGYDVVAVRDGQTALAAVERERPALVILDLMLPKLDGLEVCRRVRTHSQVPIIMLTAKGDELDRIVGLELGADDYLTKPFSPRELVARVKVVLRRTQQGTLLGGDVLDFGDLVIDAHRRAVVCRGVPVDLTAKEFDLLHCLARAAGRVYSREELLQQVWHYSYPGDTATVTVHIRRLRSKVECNPAKPMHLKTVWGVGYKFEG